MSDPLPVKSRRNKRYLDRLLCLLVRIGQCNAAVEMECALTHKDTSTLNSDIIRSLIAEVREMCTFQSGHWAFDDVELRIIGQARQLIDRANNPLFASTDLCPVDDSPTDVQS